MNDDLIMWLRAALDEDEAWATAAATFDHDALGYHWQWVCSNCDTVISPDPVLDEILECSAKCDATRVALRSVEVGPPGAYRTGLPAFIVPYAEEQPTVAAAHIARWDPARVLAEVAAKREIIKVVLWYEAKIDGEWGCCHSEDSIGEGNCPGRQPNDIEVLRLLALPYADRPGYRESWRP